MQETRQARICRMLQKELAAIFQAQTRMMPGVLVSVTRVRISPDLSICTANLSVFPSERGEEIIKNIQAHEKQIRYELGTRVRNQLRIIPELRFFIISISHKDGFKVPLLGIRIIHLIYPLHGFILLQ